MSTRGAGAPARRGGGRIQLVIKDEARSGGAARSGPFATPAPLPSLSREAGVGGDTRHLRTGQPAGFEQLQAGIEALGEWPVQ